MRALAEHLLAVLGGATCAIPIAQARECHPLPMLRAAAPGSPADVLGFVDVRGVSYPVVRPQGRSPAAPLRREDAILILDTPRGAVAVLADAVTGIRRLRSGRSFSLDEAPLPILDTVSLWRDARPAAPPALAWEPPTQAERLVFASRARTLAAAPAPAPPDATPVVLVEVGGRGYAVALDHVRAFVETSGAVPIPRSPPHVRGDLNVRGEIVTVFDARKALGFDDPAPARADKALVVASGQEVAALLVDRIGDIVYLKPGQIRDLATWDVDEMLHGRALAVEEVSA